MNISIQATSTYAPFGRTNVDDAIQECCLLILTGICVTLNTYRRDVKRGNLEFWLFRNFCYVSFNSYIQKTSQVR